jgi:hypothetical protein
VKAQAALYVTTDVEGRRHREQTGLDTQVVFAVNDERHRLDKILIDSMKSYSKGLIY